MNKEYPPFKRPDPLCPKCNSMNGFLYARPAYHSGIEKEYLVWRCSFCGYEVVTSTADAK